MILQFADGTLFPITDAQTREVMIENIMRPGLVLSAEAAGKRELRELEDMFDESTPAPRERLVIYHNETDPDALRRSLDGLPEGIPGPAGGDQPYIGYTKVGRVDYEKYRMPDPEGAETIPEPAYGWRLTVEIGQRTHSE